jgi:hypothetical protein
VRHEHESTIVEKKGKSEEKKKALLRHAVLGAELRQQFVDRLQSISSSADRPA